MYLLKCLDVRHILLSAYHPFMCNFCCIYIYINYVKNKNQHEKSKHVMHITNKAAIDPRKPLAEECLTK